MPASRSPEAGNACRVGTENKMVANRAVDFDWHWEVLVGQTFRYHQKSMPL
jgi:hypothetical protein